MYIVGIVLVVLAVGFAAAWLYLQRTERLSKEIAYLTLPRVAISRDGHSMAATMAVRTSAADAAWAADNAPALEQVMKKALMEADPVTVRLRDGLPRLQERLRDITNDSLQTSRIQEVLVTDFLVSEGDL